MATDKCDIEIKDDKLQNMLATAYWHACGGGNIALCGYKCNTSGERVPLFPPPAAACPACLKVLGEFYV